jgi:hypothetical protein
LIFKGGVPAISIELQRSIQSHMESNSEIAANRSIVVGKGQDNEKNKKAVRCRDLTLFEIYNNYEFKDELAFSTFCSYIGPEFKSPFRPSDLCDW